MSNITDPERAAKAMLGQIIEGIEVHEDSTVTVKCSRGFMLINFDDGEIYIEVKEQQ
jgi:hypothetical protein